MAKLALAKSHEGSHAKWTFQVLESHLDSFGHMNHAKYLEFFEQARWEFATARGYGLKEVHEHQVGPIVLEVKIRYLRELKLRETVTIESVFPDFKTRIAKVQQRMLSKKGEEAAVIEVTMGLFDMKQRKIVDAPEAWLKAVSQHS